MAGLPQAKARLLSLLMVKSLARHILTAVSIFSTSFYLKIGWLFRGIIFKAR